MAKNKGRCSGSNGKQKGGSGFRKSGRSTHEQEVTRVAYLMGCVERGRKNPDSKISDSYKQGCTEKAKKPKKSLY